MVRMTESGCDRLQPSRAIQVQIGGVSLEEWLRRAFPVREQLEKLRGWRERMAPAFRRTYSAGRLLFQVVGVAGYAGYFASMHTLMRVVSGTLMAGAWYAIYRAKGVGQ
jgi:hypothetical protein